MEQLIFIPICLACGIIGGEIAFHRGRSGSLWSVLCCLSPLLLLVICFLPKPARA
jgi:hypothetical protein